MPLLLDSVVLWSSIKPVSPHAYRAEWLKSDSMFVWFQNTVIFLLMTEFNSTVVRENTSYASNPFKFVTQTMVHFGKCAYEKNAYSTGQWRALQITPCQVC